MKGLNVLVVDDEVPVANAIATYLDEEERNVTVAYDLQTARRLLEEGGVDLIISDVVFPGEESGDGLDLLEEIKEDKPGVEIVVMSGYGNIRMERTARKRGGFRFFHKPLDLDLIKELIANLEKKRQEGAGEERIVPFVPGTLSDEEAENLQRAYLTGDENALERILLGYRNLVFSVATRWYSLSHEDAEDLYQDLCMEVMVKISRIQKLRPFIVGTTMNMAKKALSKKKRWTPMPENYDRIGHTEPEGERMIMEKERGDVLKDAMKRLNPRERDLLNLLIYEEASYRDVVDRLGIPIGSIGPTRQKALKKLKTHIAAN